MKLAPVFLMFAVAVTSAMPVHAQWFLTKKAKVNPSQRVPELILLIKTETNDRKRAQAVEELRGFDATTFNEIVPVLVDILLQDKKANVRAEALTGLTRIRPVSAEAGQAIEKASGSDESWRIRFQAKAALARYQLAGYSAKKNGTTPAPTKKTVTTKEPPTVDPMPPLPLPSFGTPRVLDPVPSGKTVTPKKAGGTQGPSLFP